LLDEEELPVKGNNTNKYRQVFTTLVGSDLMEGKGCTTVAKIRTDQSLSLDLLHAVIKNHETQRPVSSIGVNRDGKGGEYGLTRRDSGSCSIVVRILVFDEENRLNKESSTTPRSE
jgi:hypothetical protein